MADLVFREIGPHLMILGDCMAAYERLAPVDHIICDPPYEMHAHTPRKRARRGVLTEGLPLDFVPLDRRTRVATCGAAKSLCAGWLIAFCQTEQMAGWRDDIEAAGLKYKAPMVWIKPDATPKLNGQGPAIGYESMVTAWCGKGYAKWNGGGKRGVFTYPTNGGDRVPGRHMTEKPARLMQELVTLFSNPGDVILDPFAGSGTTGVACVRTGRRFIGVELIEKHFWSACERIEQAVKQPDLFVHPPEPGARQLVLM